MTQADKANEGREEKLTDEGWSDLRLLVKRIWSRAYLDTEEKHIGLIKDHVDKELRDQLSKEREKYNDLLSSVQRHFQTLIARNYNNIGVWSNERQDYNFQLIKEIEDFLKEHNTKATELDKK